MYDSLPPIDPTHAQLQYDISLLCSGLAPEQLSTLAACFSGIAKISRSPSLGSEYLVPVLPTTTLELRSFITEYKTALLPNVSHPPVRVIDDHAYTLPSHHVSDLLARGFPMQSYSSPQSDGKIRYWFESDRAKEIYDNARIRCNDSEALILYLMEWTDGAEPNYSLSKHNRGSMWIYTMTLRHPPNSRFPFFYTFIVAIGPLSSSHRGVESIINEDLRELRNGKFRTYCKSH